jgi:hypothetical protein
LKLELGLELAFTTPLHMRRPGLFAAFAGLAGHVRAALPVSGAGLRASSQGFNHSSAAKTSVNSVRLTDSDQWSALSKVLTSAVVGAEEAGRLQKAATQQLDLAQYGISMLVDELSAVMTVAGRRDRLATLYVLGNSANGAASNAGPRSAGQALAA